MKLPGLDLSAIEVGASGRDIELVDVNGIVLASIQALNMLVQERAVELDRLSVEVDELRPSVARVQGIGDATTGGPGTSGEHVTDESPKPLRAGARPMAERADPKPTGMEERGDAVDVHEILARVAELRIETWNYKSEDPSVRHIGPMAQDFAAAFGVGGDDRRIDVVDAYGVALAAIQALSARFDEQGNRIHHLHMELERLRETLARRGAADGPV